MSMDAMLDDTQDFCDFGRDALMPYPRGKATWVEATSKNRLRTAVRQSIPAAPGVYGFVDVDGRLIYVGKSKSLKSRVLSYFLPNHEQEKAGQITDESKRVIWETQPSEFAALLREQKLISRWQPKFNVVGMPKRHRAAYLCIGRGPAELFYVSYKVDPKARAYEGPFHGATRLHRVAEVLNRVFKLRDCNDKQGFVFGDQLTLFDDPMRAGCLRAELKTCLGPCASFCSKREYEHQVTKAIAFLKCGDEQLVDQLEMQMLRSASQLHFEQAARYREDWLVLRWITRKLFENEQARNRYHFIYPVLGCDGRDIWYLIRAGKVEHAIMKPASAAQWKGARDEIQRWAASNERIAAWFDGGANTLHIVAKWFRQNRNELLRACPLEKLPKDFGEVAKIEDSLPLSGQDACSVA